MHQWSKINRVIKEFLPLGKPAKLPADPNIKLSKDMSPKTDEEVQIMAKIPYRRLVGVLLHIAITARPDICTAVSSIGRYSHNPGKQHWNAALQIVQYLIGTSRFTLRLGGDTDLELSNNLKIFAYSDSDWAGDGDNRYSRTGSAIYLNQSLVIYTSRLQGSLALSTMEAETNAGCETAQRIVWARNMLNELNFKQKTPSIIYGDNAACVTTSSSWKQHPGSRHYELKQFFLRERIVDKQDIQMIQIKTGIMTADIFTKQLPAILFYRHRHALGIRTFEINCQGSIGNGIYHPTFNVKLNK
jgi:hypothetical protein